MKRKPVLTRPEPWRCTDDRAHPASARRRGSRGPTRANTAALDALLRGLPDGWITANEGGDTWSPFDVVGHLIHGERTDWMPRVRIILEHGESRPFDKFDRFAQFDL